MQALRPLLSGFTCKSKAAGGTKRKADRFAFGLFLCVIAFAGVAASRPVLTHLDQTLSRITTPQAVDPNKASSELNHHIAGWALIGVGLLVLTSLLSSSLESPRYLWPALFVAAGFYLALWSDGEIWPRGNLNWLWLLQHDAEARQHKIYPILLLAIGVIEYLRIRGVLPRFWKRWAFPVLAIVGAGMLLVHDHTGGSGAHSPEAQAYLVNPALDVDGRPRNEKLTRESDDNALDPRQLIEAVSDTGMNAASMDHAGMQMEHSQMTMAVPSMPESHRHLMSESMLRVQREHMWFLIVGLAIGLFKFVSDGEFFRNRVVPCVWPMCILLLGFMLVFYRE